MVAVIWVHSIGGEWGVQVSGLGLRRGYCDTSPLICAIQEGLSWCILHGMNKSVEIRGVDVRISTDYIEPQLRACGMVKFIDCMPPRSLVYSLA